MGLIQKNSGIPRFETLAETVASDLALGQLVISLGDSSSLDGGGVIYLVSPNGSGGILMSNGNELLQFTGTAATADVQTSPTDTTADRLMAVGAFGVGTQDSPQTMTNDTKEGGFYNSGIDANALLNNQPYLTAGRSFGSDRAFQIQGSGAGDIIGWRGLNNGTWASWQELYHSGNTNFNEFGGVVSRLIGRSGIATSTTEVVIELDVHSFTQPTGITLSMAASNFKIKNKSFADVAVCSSITMNGVSSNRTIALNVTASGLVAGETYYLTSATTGSTIKVNF